MRGPGEAGVRVFASTRTLRISFLTARQVSISDTTSHRWNPYFLWLFRVACNSRTHACDQTQRIHAARSRSKRGGGGGAGRAGVVCVHRTFKINPTNSAQWNASINDTHPASCALSATTTAMFDSSLHSGLRQITLIGERASDFRGGGGAAWLHESYVRGVHVVVCSR